MNYFNYNIEIEEQKIFMRQYIHKIGGYRYNWHKEIEIMLILEGNVEVCVEGNIHLLKEGDIICINANHGHASLKKGKNSVAMVLHIDPVYLSSFYPDFKSLRFDCISDDNTRDNIEFKTLRKDLVKLIKSMKKDSIESKFEAIGNLGIFIAHLLKYFPPTQMDIKNTSREIKYEKLLKDIITYIEKNYYKKISLNDIAKLINYNPNYTSSFFKANVGINFYDYLSRVRLQRAITELIITDKTISNIAMDNGFSDVKIFNNCFKKNFNQSPNEYRNKNREIDPDLSYLNRKFISEENETIINQLERYLQDDDKPIENSEKVNINNYKEDKLGNIEINFDNEDKEEIANLIKNLNIELKLSIK